MNDVGTDIMLTRHELRLAARVFGPADGEPVLALHGWLDNAASFDLLAPLLPWARIVAIDLPGHGWSPPKPPGASYHMIDWVADALDAADALGWQRFIVLGHSMGGGIASFLAGTIRSRVKAVMSIDALGALTATAEEAPERLAGYLAARSRLAKKEAPVYASMEDALKARMRAGHFDREEGIRRVVTRGLKAENTPNGTVYRWRADARLTLPSAVRLTVEQVRAFLARIECPVALVKPRDGLAMVAQATEAVVDAVPRCQVLEVAGGHHVHLDHPESVAKALNEFYDTTLKGSC